MDQIVQDGVDQGLLVTPFPREASRAVITMCTGVAQWYRPGGSLDPEELARRYCAIVRMSVGAGPGADDVDHRTPTPTRGTP